MKVLKFDKARNVTEPVEVTEAEAKDLFVAKYRYFGFAGPVCEFYGIDLDDYDRWMVEDVEFKARCEKAYRLFRDGKAKAFEDKAVLAAKHGGFDKTAEFMAAIAALQRHCPEYNNKSVLTVNTTGKGAETLLERIQKDLRMKRAPKAKEEVKEEVKEEEKEEETAGDTD